MNYHLQNKPDREITSAEEISTLLKKGKYVTIGLCRDNEPYVVTLSYGYDSANNALYFHAAPTGMKMDFLKANPNVCASIIEDGGYIQDVCKHPFKTLIIRGQLSVVEAMEEKKHGMRVLLGHLEEKPSVVQQLALESEGVFSRMAVLKLEIGEVHGKAGQ
jgi:uncharacterized protein